MRGAAPFQVICRHRAGMVFPPHSPEPGSLIEPVVLLAATGLPGASATMIVPSGGEEQSLLLYWPTATMFSASSGTAKAMIGGGAFGGDRNAPIDVTTMVVIFGFSWQAASISIARHTPVMVFMVAGLPFLNAVFL